MLNPTPPPLRVERRAVIHDWQLPSLQTLSQNHSLAVRKHCNLTKIYRCLVGKNCLKWSGIYGFYEVRKYPFVAKVGTVDKPSCQRMVQSEHGQIFLNRKDASKSDFLQNFLILQFGLEKKSEFSVLKNSNQKEIVGKKKKSACGLCDCTMQNFKKLDTAGTFRACLAKQENPMSQHREIICDETVPTCPTACHVSFSVLSHYRRHTHPFPVCSSSNARCWSTNKDYPNPICTSMYSQWWTQISALTPQLKASIDMYPAFHPFGVLAPNLH